MHDAANEPRLIGAHSSMLSLAELLVTIANSKTRTVLIYGETGTGKGLAARIIHHHSPRAMKEFVDINCAAIPAQLLESELFGHERGAFTGATVKKEGLIEAANGGTVFLDEVRELDPVMQAKILSLLDAQQFRRLGSVKPIKVDVRFIAATNKILFSEVKAGKFRDDLYYRLQVIAVNIPPLRQRGDDVFLLAAEFLERCKANHGSQICRWDDNVAEVFRTYAWPGNVRELHNLLERICLLEKGDCIRREHLPERILREIDGTAAEIVKQFDSSRPPALAGQDSTASRDVAYGMATVRYQRQLIHEALAACQGNVSIAALRLGLTRHALRHQMRKLGLVTPVLKNSVQTPISSAGETLVENNSLILPIG